LLALAGRPDHRAVPVDSRRTFEERWRLLLPDSDADIVDSVRQPLDVRGPEAPAEVSGGGRIRDGSGAERIEKGDVIAAQLDVIEHQPTTQRVVRDVENMI